MNRKEMDMDALQYGTILNDRYVIKNFVGRGGAGIVYCAYDKIEKKNSAIKELFPVSCCKRKQNCSDIILHSKNASNQYRYYKDCFLKEINLMSHYCKECDNLIKMENYFTENHTHYCVMEMLSGFTLKKLFKLSKDPLPEKDILDISLQILKGLSFLHGKGFLHRDICSDNIFLTNEGVVKIIDYGSILRISESENKSLVLHQNYAPPEQYDAHTICGPYTDFYSLGAIMYEAVTKMKVPQAIRRLDEDELISPIEINKQISQKFSDSIMKALSLSTERRFQTADEFSMCLLGQTISDKKLRKKMNFDNFAKKLEQYIFIIMFFLFIVVFCILSFFI